MGLLSDVKHELSILDTSPRALRRFGLMVGGVFALLAAVGLWRDWPQPAILLMGGVGLFLMVFGAVGPSQLRTVHRWWMTFALTLGWCMSRLILTILFCLAIVPIAWLGRLIGLPFTKMRRAPRRDSYWIDHPARAQKHHGDMF
jgi:hypothetical protein